MLAQALVAEADTFVAMWNKMSGRQSSIGVEDGYSLAAKLHLGACLS
jgi:hypothetical protein